MKTVQQDYAYSGPQKAMWTGEFWEDMCGKHELSLVLVNFPLQIQMQNDSCITEALKIYFSFNLIR